MPPKKASAEPVAAVPEDSKTEGVEAAKTGLLLSNNCVNPISCCFNIIPHSFSVFDMTFVISFSGASGSASGKAAGRKVSPHPSTIEMVKEALKELDSRKGVSAQAIRSYIKEKYTTVDETRVKFMVRKALAKGLETAVFVRPANSAPTTTGAQGRFRVT